MLVAPQARGKDTGLIMPRAGADLSAYRMDVEVFGWNRSFTEVASMALEVARGRGGTQRGEAFMLVYPVGGSLPLYNVICHSITHPDLPDNPLPLGTAGEFMWGINYAWQASWPKRPMHHQPSGGMAVRPVMLPLPEEATAKGTAGSITQAGHALDAQHSCSPHAGFVLHWHNERRVMPFVALDMAARCDLVQQGDSRIYWGRKDIAAAMLQVNFNAQPNNEESARFVVSAAWPQARHITFVALGGHPLPKPMMHALTQATAQYGALRERRGPAGSQAGTRLVEVRARAAWMPLAQHVATVLGADDAARTTSEQLGDDIVLVFGSTPPAPSPEAPAKAQGTAAAQVGAAHKQAPSATPQALPVAPHGPSAWAPRSAKTAPPAHYLDGFGAH